MSCNRKYVIDETSKKFESDFSPIPANAKKLHLDLSNSNFS